MSDWQTYRLEDFIPFTPEVYWRLIERINETFWPLHVLTVALGITALILALRGHPRITLILLAPTWLTSGIIFHLTYYAELNWAAPYFGWAFIAQAVVLLAIAVFTKADNTNEISNSVATWIGATIAILGLLVYPLIAPTLGPGPTHAETYGLHPDPTVIATLGFLLIALQRSSAWLAIPIPLLWCLISTLTLTGLDSAWGGLPIAAGIVVLATLIAKAISSATRSKPGADNQYG